MIFIGLEQKRFYQITVLILHTAMSEINHYTGQLYKIFAKKMCVGISCENGP